MNTFAGRRPPEKESPGPRAEFFKKSEDHRETMKHMRLKYPGALLRSSQVKSKSQHLSLIDLLVGLD